MRHEINLRRLSGHWYMAVGTKGYACTKSFEKFLNEARPSKVVLEESPRNPWFKVNVTYGENEVYTNFQDCVSNKSYMLTQCPKMFKDLNLPMEFYINHGNS